MIFINIFTHVIINKINTFITTKGMKLLKCKAETKTKTKAINKVGKYKNPNVFIF